MSNSSEPVIYQLKILLLAITPTNAEFSPDSKLLATASSDNTARLWRAGDIEGMLRISCDWVLDTPHG